MLFSLLAGIVKWCFVFLLAIVILIMVFMVCVMGNVGASADTALTPARIAHDRAIWSYPAPAETGDGLWNHGSVQPPEAPRENKLPPITGPYGQPFRMIYTKHL